MSALSNSVDEYSEELNEGTGRFRRGCTIGRVINLCVALDFLLVMITALIVSGVLGGVNLTVRGLLKDTTCKIRCIQRERRKFVIGL